MSTSILHLFFFTCFLLLKMHYLDHILECPIGPSLKVVQLRRLFDWTNMAAALPQFFGAARHPCFGSGGIEKSHSCKWAKWIQWHALPHIQQSTQQRNKGYYPNLHGWDFSIPPPPMFWGQWHTHHGLPHVTSHIINIQPTFHNWNTSLTGWVGWSSLPVLVLCDLSTLTKVLW